MLEQPTAAPHILRHSSGSTHPTSSVFRINAPSCELEHLEISGNLREGS